MALKHHEHCDQCSKPIRADGARRDEWEGIRLVLTSEEPGRFGRGDHKRADLPGYDAPIYHSPTIDITITHQVKRSSGVTSSPAGMVLPGIVCGPECFREWMADQVDKVVADWPRGSAEV